jgi:hypothetical protein
LRAVVRQLVNTVHEPDTTSASSPASNGKVRRSAFSLAMRFSLSCDEVLAPPYDRQQTSGTASRNPRWRYAVDFFRGGSPPRPSAT